MTEQSDQELNRQLEDQRKRCFELVTTTAKADRERAEAAAREVAEPAADKIEEVVWVESPERGRAAYCDLLASRIGPVLDPFQVARGDSVRDVIWQALWDELRAPLQDAFESPLTAGSRNWLESKLWNPLRQALRGRMAIRVRGKLEEALSLALWDSLWDAERITGYVFAERLGVKYPPPVAKKLRLVEQLLESCFACWAAPGFVVLCERPASVEIRDDQLVGLTWRGEQS